MPVRAHVWLLPALAIAVGVLVLVFSDTPGDGWFPPVFGIGMTGVVVLSTRRWVRRKFGKQR